MRNLIIRRAGSATVTSSRSILPLILVSSLSFAAPAKAQTVAAPDCASVTSAIRNGDTGAPQIAPLQACGAAGRSALANLVRSAGVSNDRTWLSRLTTAAALTDPQILAASAELSQNRGATRTARVAGLQMLVNQTLGGNALVFVHDRAFRRQIELADYDGHDLSCTIIRVGEVQPDERGNAQAESQLAAVGARLASTVGDDPVVRNVARCIDETVGPEPEARLRPTDIELRASCSVFLTLRTTSDKRVSLDWSIGGTTTRGRVTVEPNRTTQFAVLGTGIVAVSYKGRPLAQVRTAQTPCGS